MPKLKIGTFKLSLGCGKRKKRPRMKCGEPLAPDAIPKYVLRILKTENEQKIYKAIRKALYLCQNLNFNKKVEFKDRKEECPKQYAKGWISSLKEYFTEGEWYNRTAVRTSKHTTEMRMNQLSDDFNKITIALNIDFRSRDVLENYDVFNEKFNEIMQKYMDPSNTTSIAMTIHTGSESLRRFSA